MPQYRDGQPQPFGPDRRICVNCRYSNSTKSPNSPCSAPQTSGVGVQTLAVGLITGERRTFETWNSRSLTDHRSAGWLKARLEGLCGREGRWYETDPSKLTPPNCAGSGVKPPPPQPQFEKRLGI